jgi:hypothetical protein
MTPSLRRCPRAQHGGPCSAIGANVHPSRGPCGRPNEGHAQARRELQGRHPQARRTGCGADRRHRPSWSSVDGLRARPSRRYRPEHFRPIVAPRTAGVDVKRTSKSRAAYVAVGRRARLPCAPREGPECPQKPAFHCERELGLTSCLRRSHLGVGLTPPFLSDTPEPKVARQAQRDLTSVILVTARSIEMCIEKHI